MLINKSILPEVMKTGYFSQQYGVLYVDTVVFRIDKKTRYSALFLEVINRMRPLLRHPAKIINKPKPNVPPFRVTLQCPIQKALEILNDVLIDTPYLLMRVDLAYDIAVCDAKAGFLSLTNHFVMRWPGNNMPWQERGTLYFRPRHWGVLNVAIYADRLSKITKQRCVHIDFRFSGRSVRHGLGCTRLTEIYSLLGQHFIDRYLTLEKVDHERLAKYWYGQQQLKVPPCCRSYTGWARLHYRYFGGRLFRHLGQVTVPALRLQARQREIQRFPESRRKEITPYQCRQFRRLPARAMDYRIAFLQRQKTHPTFNAAHIMQKMTLEEVMGDNLMITITRQNLTFH